MTAAEYQLPFQLYVFRILFFTLIFTFILHNMCTSDSSTTSMTAPALSGRRYDAEFQRWFVPEYKHERGRQNLMEIALKAAEFLVDLFAIVWSPVGQTSKVPYGS